MATVKAKRRIVTALAALVLMSCKSLLLGFTIGGGVLLFRGSYFRDAWDVLHLRRA